MIRTVEAVIDEHGSVLLQEAVAPSAPRRALVTILEEEPYPNDVAMLSEAALAEDWDRPEEEAAWSPRAARWRGSPRPPILGESEKSR